jgi:hypothetical protein
VLPGADAARAQGTRPTLPDSTRIAAPDSAARPTIAVEDTVTGHRQRIPAPPDTTAAAAERALELARAERRLRAQTRGPRGLDAPRWVMLRSLLVPGWGQFHNRSYLKAVGVAAWEVSLIVKIVEDERELDHLAREADRAQAVDEARFDALVAAYNQRLSSTVARRWLLGGLLAFALADAYVDAHFRGFNVEFDTDPEAGGAGARLRVGRSF